MRLNLNLHIYKTIARLHLHVQNAELVIITFSPEIGIENADIGSVYGHFQNGTQKARKNAQMLAEHSLEYMVVDRRKQLLFHDLNISLISAKGKAITQPFIPALCSSALKIHIDQVAVILWRNRPPIFRRNSA